MTIAIVALTLVLLAAGAAAAGIAVRWRRPAVRRRVTVSLVGKEGGVEGVLMGYRGAWLHLEQARFLSSDRRANDIDGSVFIPREKILVIQDSSGIARPVRPADAAPAAA